MAGLRWHDEDASFDADWSEACAGERIDAKARRGIV